MVKRCRIDTGSCNKALSISSLAKDGTSEPFMVTCSSVRKNDEKNGTGVVDPYLGKCTLNFFNEISLQIF